MLRNGCARVPQPKKKTGLALTSIGETIGIYSLNSLDVGSSLARPGHTQVTQDTIPKAMSTGVVLKNAGTQIYIVLESEQVDPLDFGN